MKHKIFGFAGHCIVFPHNGPIEACKFINSLPNIESIIFGVEVFFLGEKAAWDRIRKGGFRGPIIVRIDVIYAWLQVRKG